jgi:hypothetical protein
MLFGTEMSLQPRFEDVLHLVMWNGYTEDCRQAVYVSKEVHTDERVWFPFLAQQTYGDKKKTLPQIIAEHCTNVEPPQMRKIFPTKDGVIIYRPEERWLTRMNQLKQMADDSHHTKIFEKILNKADTDGNTALVAASKNNCPKITSYLLKRGIDYDQENASGATPSYHGYNSKLGRNAWNSLISESKFKAVYKSPRREPIVFEPMLRRNIEPMVHYRQYFRDIEIPQLINDLYGYWHQPEPEPEPPKKKLKRSEYKKQFGRR